MVIATEKIVNSLSKKGVYTMIYIKPAVVVFSREDVDNIIGAAACGSKPGSCYGGCNGDGCTFTIG